MSDAELQLPELEYVCGKCDGTGEYTDCGQILRCGWCDGAGYIPTKLGERILALMRHNFRPMLEDARGD